MRLLRGEIWWVELDPSRGAEIQKTRPCVVISSDMANARRRTVIVVPFSTSPKEYPPFTVEVHCAGKKVCAIVDQTRAVARERFVRRQEVLAAAELKAIEGSLALILGL